MSLYYFCLIFILGYNQMFIIPVGATSISIRETVGTRNYIGEFIRLKECASTFCLIGSQCSFITDLPPEPQLSQCISTVYKCVGCWRIHHP